MGGQLIALAPSLSGEIMGGYVREQHTQVVLGVLLKLRAKRNAHGQALGREAWGESLSFTDSLCGLGQVSSPL